METLATDSIIRVFGRDFYGAEAVTRVFTPGAKNESPVKLTPEEQVLEKLRKAGNFIIARTDKSPDGEPLTMQKQVSLLQEEFKRRKLGEILYDYKENRGWLEDQAFYMVETPKPGLYVVSNSVIPGSRSADYGKQTGVLEKYILAQVPEGRNLSARGQEAISDWEDKRDDLQALLRSDWKQGGYDLAAHPINQLFSPRAVDVLYDLVVPLLDRGEQRLVDVYTRVCSITSGGYLVSLGYFDLLGARVRVWDPYFVYPVVGGCLSAELKDLGF